MKHSKYFSLPEGHIMNGFVIAMSKVDLLNEWSINIDHMEAHEDFSLMVTSLTPIGLTVTM